MTTRAQEERRAAARVMEDLAVSDEDAVTLCMLVHTVTPGVRWTCTCEKAPGLGTSYYAHQADEVLALLRRRGWKRGFRLNHPKHWCANCDGVEVGSCVFNSNREADDVAEKAAATSE